MNYKKAIIYILSFIFGVCAYHVLVLHFRVFQKKSDFIHLPCGYQVSIDAYEPRAFHIVAGCNQKEVEP